LVAFKPRIEAPTPTAETPMTVAALIRSAPERIRFASAVRHNIAVRFASDASEMIDLIAGGEIAAAIIGLHGDRRENVAPAAVSIQRRFPSLAVLFYFSLDGGDVREALALASTVTPHAVILRGVDDVSLTITQAVFDTRQAGATQRIVALVSRVAPPGLGETLAFMARHTARPLHVADVARYAGVSRRTLFNRFRQSGLPTVARVIHWLRLLHAAARFEAPDVTVEQVADALGFPSSSTLRHLLKRLTAMTASSIRDAGGFGYLLARAEQILSGDERSRALGQDGAEDDDAAHDALHGGVDVGQIERVVERADAHRADYCAEYAPTAPRKRGAADDHRGDHVELIL
jgi:AraC-like DNA-binding protein